MKPPSLAAPMPTASLAITKVGVDPKTLDVGQQQVATIRYELTQPAAVRVELVDEDGFVVRSLDGGEQSAGLHTMTWDGRTDTGAEASSGVYRYVIRAQASRPHSSFDTRHSTILYEPSRDTGGEELMPWDFTFDHTTGTLRWAMPKAGYARLRAGLEGFPHLRTLLDWQPLEAGEQTLVWDGLDASGLIRLRDHPTLSLKLQAFALPWNTLIVRDGARSLPSASHSSFDIHHSSLPEYPPLSRPDASYLHARHPRTQCHEVRLGVEFPDGTGQDGDGRPVVSGTVPVRAVLDERDAPHAVNSRFEVAVYEDTTFLMEEEDGSSPFTYLWDTTRLPAGEHLLTVNILTYDDHYGVVTQPVWIE